MHELALPLLAFPLSRIFETGFNSDLRSYRQSRGTSAPGSSSRQSAADALPDLSTLVINDAQNTTATPAPFELSSTRPTQHLLFQSISLQLLTALAHLHKLGIAHRDIKPDNIMFAWDGAVLLVDFGTCWDEGGEDWGSEWKECRDAESADGEGGLYERSDADVNADADAERGLCMEVGTGYVVLASILAKKYGRPGRTCGVLGLLHVALHTVKVTHTKQCIPCSRATVWTTHLRPLGDRYLGNRLYLGPVLHLVPSYVHLADLWSAR